LAAIRKPIRKRRLDTKTFHSASYRRVWLSFDLQIIAMRCDPVTRSLNFGITITDAFTFDWEIFDDLG
jgi:hypothetical protein